MIKFKEIQLEIEKKSNLKKIWIVCRTERLRLRLDELCIIGHKPAVSEAKDKFQNQDFLVQQRQDMESIFRTKVIAIDIEPRRATCLQLCTHRFPNIISWYFTNSPRIPSLHQTFGKQSSGWSATPPILIHYSRARSRWSSLTYHEPQLLSTPVATLGVFSASCPLIPCDSLHHLLWGFSCESLISKYEPRVLAATRSQRCSSRRWPLLWVWQLSLWKNDTLSVAAVEYHRAYCWTGFDCGRKACGLGDQQFHLDIDGWKRGWGCCCCFTLPEQEISDQVLKKCQNDEPSASEWFMVQPMKMPSASSVTCTASNGLEIPW